MAEETTTPTTATETSPTVEEEVPNKHTEAIKEEEAEEAKEIEAEEAKEIEAETKEIEAETMEIEVETKDIAPIASDHKRKLEDLEGDEGGKKTDEPDLESNEKKDENEVKTDSDDGSIDVKRQRVDGDAEGLDGSQDGQKEAQPFGNGLPHSENIESEHVDTVGNSTEGVSQQGVFPSAVQKDTAQISTEGVPQQSTLSSAGQQDTSRKIEVPNDKVGVLIGKSGETIRLLQNGSGAKIQITRDADCNPNSSTRPVELTGTLDNINKAEQLIKDVIAEADAGGSPALVARGFGASQSGSELYEMQVPNEKVGWIIGRSGETIKNLQTKSHARIQLIPQHLPDGDYSSERTVRITGNKKQIEAAKIMIKDVMTQQPGRQSNPGHTHGYRPPRGPSSHSQWGHRGAPPQVQSQMPSNTAYDYPQRGGTYQQPQNMQYPQQPYGGGDYTQQPPQRPAAAPVQMPHGGGYDYYGQGQAMGAQPSSYASPAPTSAAPNYNNYGQPQPAVGYGHQANPYSQSAPPQQSYGGYENQAPYGQQQQQPGGYYSQQGGGYVQQQPPSYGSKPAAAAAAYAGAQQPQSAYGPPASQGPMSSSYGSGGPTTQQQPYPYGSSPAPASQPAAYGQGYGTASTDGYSQAPTSATAAAGGYSQPPSYGQGYNTQPGGAGGYGQYPPPAAAYGDQSAAPANNANYGYQAGAGGGGYGGGVPANVGGYGAAAPAPAAAYGTQPGYGGYAQAPAAAAAANYDQSAAGYGSAPPVGYAKGVSPQPAGTAPYGGGGQYDSVPPVYGGGHH